MEEIKLSIEKLINESPIDEATRHHDKSHMLNLVQEDISDIGGSNTLHTDKNYRTHRIEEAAIGSIKDKLGRWSNVRNDIVLKAKGIVNQQSNSELDIKKRKLYEEMEGEKAKAKDSYMRNNNYADLKANHELTKKRYENMRAELGGKPPVSNRFWLYAIVILSIGSVEWAINYTTFSSKYPPGIAIGATILVALSFALASHFHGGLLKQRLSLFARHRKKEEKRQVLIKQSFFSLLLIISLFIVTYNRYDTLMSNMLESGGIALAGIDNSSESIIGVLTQFLMLNILVWIVGVAFSYFIHDPRPDYQESFKHYEVAKKKFHRVDTRLQEEIERIGQEFDEDLKSATNSLANHQASIKELSNLLERLASKEAALIMQALNSINDMLEKHHAILITELNALSKTSLTIGPDALSIDQFKTKKVTVDAQFIRNTLSLEAI